MGKTCAVPDCWTSSRREPKCSIFRVPKDIGTKKKWEEVIPGNLTTDVVCEKKFNEEDICREWIKLDENGQKIAQVNLMTKIYMVFENFMYLLFFRSLHTSVHI